MHTITFLTLIFIYTLLLLKGRRFWKKRRGMPILPNTKYNKVKLGDMVTLDAEEVPYFLFVLFRCHL